MSDELGRTPISDAMKSRVSQALMDIPEWKRGALIVVADEHGTRMQLAANIDGGRNWKIAAGAGWEYGESKPSGYIAVVGAW